MPKIPPYSLEFRREAVQLLRRSGKSVPQLADELGVSPQSLRNWNRQVDVEEGNAPGLTSDEREELRLRLPIPLGVLRPVKLHQHHTDDGDGLAVRDEG